MRILEACCLQPAGEMESEWAGAPAKMIRERYRTAADRAKVRGKCATRSLWPRADPQLGMVLFPVDCTLIPLVCLFGI